MTNDTENESDSSHRKQAIRTNGIDIVRKLKGDLPDDEDEDEEDSEE